MQVAMIHALANGRAPTGFSLFDKNGIKDYDYAQDGTETLQTRGRRQFATIIYRSHRPDSPRSTRFWCAPDFGYMPGAGRAADKGEGANGP